MEATPAPQPAASSFSVKFAFSGQLREILDNRLKTTSDLWTELPSLHATLDQDCRDLNSDLFLLGEQLSLAASRWISRSDEVRETLRYLQARPPLPFPVTYLSFLEMELLLMEREVIQIEKLCLYAETSLQFEGLVGDLEDATLSIFSHASQNRCASGPSSMLAHKDITCKHKKLLYAIKIMTEIENLLARILDDRNQWNNLSKAVDFRVDRALAALRTQALTDHRSLLTSLGWPPSLSSKLEKNEIMEIPNPLVLMQGEKKDEYFQSFVLLCSLQHFQHQREARQHNNLSNNRNSFSGSVGSPALFVGNDLWTINELANPIASKMELHFARWFDQPKYIFALVYKITRDLMDGVENILQPLIDIAKLVGVSAKDAWITAMVRVLLKYLETKIFPVYCVSYSGREGIMEVTSSWLHLVDLMATFDRRMQDFATSGSSSRVPILSWEEFSRSLSIFSVFNDHSDWLHIWAEIELKEAEDKLKSELENGWSSSSRQKGVEFNEKAEIHILATVEDFKVPPIADYVVKIAWEIVERARHLPSTKMQACFIRSSVVVFLKNFFHILLQRYQDAKGELMKTNIEDDVLLTLAGCVNITRYIEFVIREWSDDVNFLEMSMVENDAQEKSKESQLQGTQFFSEEIDLLVKLGTECLVEIMSNLLLLFDALCQEYINDIEKWDKEEFEDQDQFKNEQNQSVSPTLIEALQMLHNSLSSLKLELNSKDFFDLWRSIADAIDYFIFRGILQRNVKFSRMGVYQIRVDITALFQIFCNFCARPDAFFPFLSDSLKLLKLDYKDRVFLLNAVTEGDREKERFLRRKGLSHLTVSQVVKVLNTKD